MMVYSPLMAARVTLDLNAGEWFRLGRLLMISSSLHGINMPDLGMLIHLYRCSNSWSLLYYQDTYIRLQRICGRDKKSKVYPNNYF